MVADPWENKRMWLIIGGHHKRNGQSVRACWIAVGRPAGRYISIRVPKPLHRYLNV